MNFCVFVRFIQTWVRGYSTKFPRRNGCRGLKFCMHIQIGQTRWKMLGIDFGVPRPHKKRGTLILFKIAWNGEKIDRNVFFYFGPTFSLLTCVRKFVKKLKKIKLLEIAWNGEKINQICCCWNFWQMFGVINWLLWDLHSKRLALGANAVDSNAVSDGFP